MADGQAPNTPTPTLQPLPQGGADPRLLQQAILKALREKSAQPEPGPAWRSPWMIAGSMANTAVDQLNARQAAQQLANQEAEAGGAALGLPSGSVRAPNVNPPAMFGLFGGGGGNTGGAAPTGGAEPPRPSAPVPSGDLSLGSGSVPIEAAKFAIAGNEADAKNPYGTIGPVTRNGDRAYGKYQVMGRQLQQELREAGLPIVSQEEFLRRPDLQEKHFEYHFGKLMNDKDNPGFNNAASMWFSGKPFAGNTRNDGYMSVPAYVTKANNNLKRYYDLNKSAPAGGSPSPAVTAPAGSVAPSAAPGSPPGLLPWPTNAPVIKNPVPGQNAGGTPLLKSALAFSPDFNQTFNDLQNPPSGFPIGPSGPSRTGGPNDPMQRLRQPGPPAGSQQQMRIDQAPASIPDQREFMDAASAGGTPLLQKALELKAQQLRQGLPQQPQSPIPASPQSALPPNALGFAPTGGAGGAPMQVAQATPTGAAGGGFPPSLGPLPGGATSPSPARPTPPPQIGAGTPQYTAPQPTGAGQPEQAFDPTRPQLLNPQTLRNFIDPNNLPTRPTYNWPVIAQRWNMYSPQQQAQFQAARAAEFQPMEYPLPGGGTLRYWPQDRSKIWYQPNVQSEPYEVAGIHGTRSFVIDPVSQQRVYLGSRGPGTPPAATPQAAPIVRGPNESDEDFNFRRAQDVFRKAPTIMPTQDELLNDPVGQGAKYKSYIDSDKDYREKDIHINEVGQNASVQYVGDELLKRVLQDPRFISGYYAGTIKTWSQAGQLLGLSQGQIGTLQSIAEKLGAQSQVNDTREIGSSGQGVVRGNEAKAIEKSQFSLEGNSPEANLAIVNNHQKLMKRGMEIPQLAAAYKEGHNGRLDSGFDTVLSNYYRDKPLYNDEEIAAFTHKYAMPSVSDPGFSFKELKPGEHFRDREGNIRQKPLETR